MSNSATPDESAKRLLVIVLNAPNLLDDLLTGFLDIGVRGATVVESRGMGQIIRQEMPVFAGLASLFGESTGSQMLFSLVPLTQVDSILGLVDELSEESSEPNPIICLTLPVDAVRGL